MLVIPLLSCQFDGFKLDRPEDRFYDNALVMSTQLKPILLISQMEIQAAVRRLVSEISRDYRARNPLLVGILKGSFMFMADLIRLLDFPLEVEFVRLSSYGKGHRTSGKVRVVQGLRSPVRGRDVLVIEDIIDTGLTTSFLLDYLRKRKPASLRVCVLTDKPSRRQVPVPIDYLGFSVPNKFIVGYGIDWNEQFRNLPDICYVEVEEPC